MLSCTSQWQPLNPNENRSIPQRKREPCNNFRRGINSRTQTLTTPSLTMRHPNMANRFYHFLHSIPETPNAHHGNHFTNHTYQTAQTRGHAHHTSSFKMMNTPHEQQAFHHRGFPRSDHSLYSTFPHKYYNYGLHNSNIITDHPEAIPFG